MSNPKILLSYDKNYQDYIYPVINSTLDNCKDSHVFCMVTSDVTNKVEHPRVKYFQNDPQEIFGNYRSAPHVRRSKAPYNFLHGLNILKDEADKIIICGIDRVNLKRIQNLYNCPLGKMGVAAIPVEKYGHSKEDSTIKNCMIKNFSNIDINSDLANEYENVEAYATASMVIDLQILHKNNGYEFMTDILKKYDVAEMVPINMYVNGTAVHVDKSYGFSSRDKIDDINKINMLDWHGLEKPWNGRCQYQHLWNKYNRGIRQ